MRLSVHATKDGGSVLVHPQGTRAIVRGAVAALAILTLLAAALPTPAAPIRGSVDRDGFVRFSGLTGEIFIALRGPEEIFIHPNGDPPLPGPVDPLPWNGQYVPGGITFLGLGGLNGAVDVGYVIKRTATPSQLAQLRMAFQSTFTSDLVEVPLQLTPMPLPDPNAPSFVYLIPEPATATIAILGLGAIAAGRHRMKR